MVKAAIRVYSELAKDGKSKLKESNKGDYKYDYDTVFVFDTETTADEYQNLKFGSFVVSNKEAIISIGLFYDPESISEKELRELEDYRKKNRFLKLYGLAEFIEIFYGYVYIKKVPCVGFNLPFDLSRLSFDYGCARRSMKGGFTLKLSKERKNPHIIVKHNDSSQSFIRFQSTSYESFPGVFLDLKTLAVTLTDDKHITLRKAAEMFNKRHQKLPVEEHGKVNQSYIDYNIEDTLTTAELYWRLKEELEKYGIPIPLNSVYSSASIGKAWLRQIGIKPFMKLNPNFSRDVLGHLMSAYYGGRAEVKIRKTPVKVTVIDFLSMYPTMFNITGLYDILIAEKIDIVDDTDNVQKLIEDIRLEDLQKPEVLKSLNAIVEIVPDGDVLPVRTKYDENNNSFNVGINYATSNEPMWYSLPDVIASKLLSGKTPKILRAIRFVPSGVQKLNKVNTLGIEIDPNKENIFKVLIEKRQEMKANGDYRQKPVKILANSSSYGIFIEMNPKSIAEDNDLKVYSNKQFSTKADTIENVGKYFNPIISVLITGHSRLMLAITETLLKRIGKVYAFCDTDSMAVPNECVKEIQDFFQPLNPYSFDKPLFKEEKKDIWFYGISAKRYVLYEKKGDKLTIKDGDERAYSLHGLGYLLNPFGKKNDWQKEIWEDILKLHYGLLTEEDLIQKYSHFYVISQMTVSSVELIKRFKKLNKDRAYKDQIKPFNFFLTGIGNDKEIKPMSSFSKNSQEVVYKPFIDYGTGKIREGLEYWKPLSDMLLSYIDHKESKLDGSIGVLERKHLDIDGFTYIGKEASNLERTGILDTPSYPTYRDPKTAEERIASMDLNEAITLGLSRSTFYWLKKHISDRKTIKFRKKTLNALN